MLGSSVPLVESRLWIPSARPGLVPRAGLVERLSASRDTSIVAVAAPAGYGKTTLLAQWAEAEDRPVAWLTVDGTHDDPAILLTHVAAALDRAVQIDPAVIRALRRPALAVAAPRLGSAIHRPDDPFLLVLDDVHLLGDTTSIDALMLVVDHLADGSQVALSGRSLAAFSLARHRAERRVLSLGPSDLALSEDEAAELFRSIGAVALNGEIQTLVERTEGWAAGLYLAAQSVDAQGGRVASEPFTGADGLVTDYFRSELLARLPARELRFMTRTSVLDRMSGPLCDVVTGGRGSAAILERLERVTLMLVPLDHHREWYRYHHLLRDVLRQELERREPGRALEYLRRSAEWHWDHAMPEQAVDHAIAAGDAGLAARLLAKVTLPMYRDGRLATLERWFAWFDANELMGAHAPVALLAAWLRMLSGDAAGAEQRLALAERGFVEGSLVEGDPPWESWVAALEAALCREGPERMLADAERALAGLPADDVWRSAALMEAAVAKRLLGNADAEADLARTADAAVALGAAPTASMAFTEIAIAAADQGDWTRASSYAERARAVVEGASLQDYGPSIHTYAFGARLAAQRGDRPRTEEYLARAQRLRPAIGYAMPWLAVQARLQLVHAYLALADAAGARTVVREIREILLRRPRLGLLVTEAELVEETVRSLPRGVTGVSTVTAAELRVLPYLQTHLSFQEIADRLYLSRNTVKSHVLSVYRKLGVSSRSDAVARAREIGLIEG